MASVIKIGKKNISDPRQWFIENWDRELESDGYVDELSEKEDYYVFEDFSEETFWYTDTDKWLELAGDSHLIYGSYSEDMLAAEYIEIKDGKLIREFRVYSDDDSDDVDMGEEPAFDDWVDVSVIVDGIL